MMNIVIRRLVFNTCLPYLCWFNSVFDWQQLLADLYTNKYQSDWLFAGFVTSACNYFIFVVTVLTNSLESLQLREFLKH